MRSLAWLIACFSLVSCGGTVAGDDVGLDAASDASQAKDSNAGPDAPAPPFDAGTFCGGPAPRLRINGSDVLVIKATGKSIALDCCDSAELSVATSAYQAMLNVLWRNPASTNGATIDLGSPPSGFAIEMDLGCDPSTTSCANGGAEERYTDGFSGIIDYTTGGSGPTTSYCIQVAESPSQPHAIIHSMQLYAPTIPSQ